MDRMTNTMTGEALVSDRPDLDEYDWRHEALDHLASTRRPKWSITDILGEDGKDAEVRILPEQAAMPIEIIRIINVRSYYYDGSFEAWVLRSDGSIARASMGPERWWGGSRLDPPEWDPPFVVYHDETDDEA